MLCISGERAWQITTLKRSSDQVWTSHDYLEVPGSVSHGWIVVFDGAPKVIAHASYQMEGLVAQGTQEAVLDAVEGQSSLSLTWFESNETSDTKTTTAEEPTFDMLWVNVRYFQGLYEKSKAIELLDAVVEASMKAVEKTKGTAGISPAFVSLANGLQDRFDHTRNTTGIDEATESMQKVISVISENDPTLPTLLHQLGIGQRVKFLSPSNHLSDILDSITSHRTALALSHSNSGGERPGILHSLAISLWRTFEFTLQLSYLEEANQLGMESVESTPDNHPMLYKRMFDLGRLLDARLTARQIFADGEEAISLMLRAINLAGQTGDSYLVADMVNTLGFAMLNKYSTRLEKADLSEALHIFDTALEIAPDDHRNLADILQNYGRALIMLSNKDDDPSKLESALSTLRRSVELTNSASPDLPRRLHGLGTALQMKFGQTQELTLIQEAISCFQRAFQLEPRGSGLIGIRARELSAALGVRCSATGETMDIDDMIALVEVDIKTLEAKGNGAFLQVLEDLGLTYLYRYQANGNLEDIKAAISAFERAINTATPDHFLLPSLFDKLAMAYEEKYLATTQPSYLDDAIRFKRKAIAATPPAHARFPFYRISLSKSLRVAYRDTSVFKYVEEAIQHQTEVAETVSEAHGMLGPWYMELAYSSLEIHDKTGDWAYLERGLDLMAKAGGFVPDSGLVDVPQRASALAMMATVLQSTPTEVKQAVGYYKEAALAPFGPTFSRLKAARMWAGYARSFDLPSSLEGHGRAIDLISEFIGLEQTQSRRHDNIAQISKLSRAAAATALDAGEVAKALDWLERGRCLVWAQLNSLRTPVDELRHIDEQLAERVVQVSQALERSSGPKANVDSAIEWKALVSEVQQKPGFEDFLKPKSFDMRDFPTFGTVVIINAHDSRCDALALRASWSSPLHIPLPLFSLAKAVKMVEGLRVCQREGGMRMRGLDDEDTALDDSEERAVGRYRRKARERKLSDDLRDLWLWVVRPILEGLGCLQEGTTLQRIWWCPTGPLSSLPLHAAGAYDSARSTTRDFAISSYIPNVATLVKIMKSKTDEVLTNDTPGLLIISQPATPRQPRLPGVRKEVAVIRGILSEKAIPELHLEGEAATVKSVVNNMSSHGAVHLACHASQHPEEPLQSGFALQDGKLTLSEVMKANLHRAGLAFLSACQTSTGDEKLSEEAMHLAAGMLAAGYQSAVATMWSIKDRYAPDVARDFYAELTRLNSVDGRASCSAGKAAEALHYAVGQLQTMLGNSEGDLLTWAPYVHFGV